MRPLAILLGLALLMAPAASSQCEMDKVFASNRGDTDQFGASVAIGGETMIVGAHFNDEFGPNAGAAYIFKLQTDGGWREVDKLIASDAAADDRFGFSVDIWQSRTAVVGARYNDDVGYGSGSIYVFEADGQHWREAAKLVADDEQVGALFGAAVAVHEGTLVAGASDDDHAGVSSGSAYVFSKLRAGWSQTAKLTASDAAMDDRFGASVDVDGDALVVGAYGANHATAGPNAGAVYVYERRAGVWNEVQKLVPEAPEAGSLFGQQVRVAGGTILVGAVFGTGSQPGSGTAYVFERQPDGSWAQAAQLRAKGGLEGDMFGQSVAISGDTALVGAWAASNSAGSVYVFKRTATGWVQATSFQARDAQSFEHFGFGLGTNGVYAAVGARQANDADGKNTGSVYVASNIGSVTPYGTPSPGSGGFTPTLEAVGCPSPGGEFSLVVEGGLGGSTAIYFFGLEQADIPFGPPGGRFNVWPILPVQFFVPLDGSGPGNGAASLDLVIPVDAPSVSLTTQVWILDASVPSSGASATTALQIRID